MKMFQLKFVFLFLFAALFLSSCLGNDDEADDLSSEAYFVSLTFGKNDSIPNLNKAVFTISEDSTTIQNVDSLPYKTRIDSVYPSFVFASTYATYLVYKDVNGKDSLFALNGSGKDTIDFTLPMRVRNISADKSDTLTYFLKVNVHQVEPELYLWQKVQAKLSNIAANNQHALLFGNNIHYYLSDGSTTQLYTASKSDYGNWTTSSLSGLPASSISLRHMQVLNNSLYLFSKDNKIYSSSDGKTWTNIDFPESTYSTVDLLCSFLGKLWGIVQDKATSKYYIAYSANGTDWTVSSTELNSEFPIEEYASLAFTSRLGQEKVIVVGGERRSAISPYPYVWGSEDGLGWVNFAQANKTYEPVLGASLIHYDDKLLMFQAADTTHMMESINEGFSWMIPDTAYNKLPETYQYRTYPSVIVDKSDKRIFILGGYNADNIFSDVWTAKLNRMYWE